MSTEVNTTVKINGIDYVPASSIKKNSVNNEGLPYVLVRSGQAGVFVGYLVSREGSEVVLSDSRRIFYWDGAATLSQLATEGTSKPNSCKFPCSVSLHTILDVCEILPVTETARISISKVKIWST